MKLRNTDYIAVAVIAVAALYIIYKAYLAYMAKKEIAQEQVIGQAIAKSGSVTLRSDTGAVTNLKVPAAQESALDSGKLLLRFTDSKGQLTTFKVDVSQLNPYQKWYVSQGYWQVKDGVLQPVWWLKMMNPLGTVLG